MADASPQQLKQRFLTMARSLSDDEAQIILPMAKAWVNVVDGASPSGAADKAEKATLRIGGKSYGKSD